MIVQQQDLLTEAITWEKTADPEYPFTSQVNGDNFVIRVNDFPADNLYTLLVNDRETIDFDDWPKQWKRQEEAMEPGGGDKYAVIDVEKLESKRFIIQSEVDEKEGVRGQKGSERS